MIMKILLLFRGYIIFEKVNYIFFVSYESDLLVIF